MRFRVRVLGAIDGWITNLIGDEWLFTIQLDLIMTATSPRLPQRSLRRIARRLLTGLGFGLLTLIGGCWLWRSGNDSANRRLIAEVREAGEPMTLPDVQARRSVVADPENAAVPLLDLWESESPEFWSKWRVGSHPTAKQAEPKMPPELVELVRTVGWKKGKLPMDTAVRSVAAEYLKAQSDHLAAVRVALRRPRADFKVDPREWFGTLLPHQREMRREARLFWLEALLAIDRGDADAAIRVMGDLERVADLLAEEPTMEGHLVRLSSASRAVGVVEYLLCRGTPTARQLVAMEQVLAKLSFLKGLSHAFSNERAMALHLLSMPIMDVANLDGDPDGDGIDQLNGRPLRMAEWLYVMAGWKAADTRLVLTTYARAIELSGDPTPQNLQELRRVFETAKQSVASFPPKYYSGVLLPALTGFGDSWGVLEARRRLAWIAVAIERHRLAHGGMVPQRIEELDSLPPNELLQDVFLPQPLKFVRSERGYRIYSVGKDRSDEGGRVRPSRGPVDAFDETFTVER